MFKRGVVFAVAFFCVTLFCGCSTVVYTTNDLPFSEPKFTIEPFDHFETSIGKVYADHIALAPDESGAILISSGVYALFHRIAFARMAEHTIEMQTYIYENDITSKLLIHEMLMAADRGVKVRILVDDFGLNTDHSYIMHLDYHPNIEVRVFNPIKYRNRLLRYPQIVTDLARLNYRMHNKLFIVDNSVVIIGGRNVASNYFDNNVKVNFSDTDVLFLGRLAIDCVESFNDYWDYHMSIPAKHFPKQNKPEKLEELKLSVEKQTEESPVAAKQYHSAIETFISMYENRQYPVYWGKGVLIGDKPEKAEGKIKVSPIIDELERLWDESEKSIYISAAYFVPGVEGNKQIIKAVEHGVDVHILTNSLSSTDAKVVYAGWMRYRDELLKNGVNIYEFRNEGYKVSNRVSSGASLHSKVIVFDDEITWVGSFNLDGRSAALNTEVIAAFYSEEFAEITREAIKMDMSDNSAWKLSVKDGKTVWTTIRDGKEITLTHSPDSALGMRILMHILAFIVPEQLI